MRRCVALSAIVANLLVMMTEVFAQGTSLEIKNIETVVIIYAENRSFNIFYGHFPGADGLANVRPGSSAQVDRDGSVLKELPRVWDGLTAPGVTPPVQI